MMENLLAKTLLVNPDRIININDEISLSSEVMYNDKNEIVMHDVCPLCNIKHDAPFQYVDGMAQIVCPNTGVKIYAIYG